MKNNLYYWILALFFLITKDFSLNQQLILIDFVTGFL